MFKKNKDLVVAKMKNMGFEILEIRTEQEWTAIAGRLKIFKE
jgi:ribosomal protein L11 methylase PrmA